MFRLQFILGALFGACVFAVASFDGIFVLKARSVHFNEPKNIIRDSIGAYFVKCEREKDAEFTEQIRALLKLSGIRVEYVFENSKILSKGTLNKLLDSDKYYAYSGEEVSYGEVGCYMGHVKAWQKFLESDAEFAIISEDGATPHPLYKSRVVDVVNRAVRADKIWDILLLGGHHHGLVLNNRHIDGDTAIVTYLNKVSQADMYVINRHAARELLMVSNPMIMPVGHLINRTWEMSGVKLAGVEPLPIYQSFISPKVITEPNKNRDEMIAHWVYSAKTTVSTFVWNLFTWIKIRLSY